MNHILYPITYRCNLSCAKCCSKDDGQVVDIDQSMKTIESQKGAAEWVYITGGEPFLVDELPAVIDKIKSFGFKCGVTTNGTIFRPEIADHADRVGISLDGDRKYHDAYRGAGVFDKAIDLFDAIKGKCETVIMSTRFKENVEALERLRPIVESLDPTYWQLQNEVMS